MTRLDFADYLRHLESDSARFREVLADCDPDARVPGCPDWTAADLLWHLARVQWFWGTTIRTRPAPPEGDDDDEVAGPERPASYDGLLAAYDEYSALLVSELRAADPAEPAWSWSTEQTVGFTYRRQAHEALIHRLDAEQTAGQVTALDPVLATDGVDECLDIMFGGAPPWGAFAPLPHFVRIDVTDQDESVWVQLGRFTGTDPDGEHHDLDDIRVVPAPESEADAVVSGPAAALDAWLWRRGDDSDVRVTGARDVYDLFRLAVNQPIT
ncbi:maleylpyruvate isomerase N-terminal domain-containing protein [Nocardioides hankookensis]|uniref:Maleylpyruvate isomerase N-terminal domain-containing protein n=1 Tax=Nocardioides hankookensis TaxID=443157 RepID=A0ABW1LP55_9ACTN